jgi:hypothetical protein
MLEQVSIPMARAALAERGFARLDGLADSATLDSLRRSVARLEQQALGTTHSTPDMVLQADMAGGWAAWQGGQQPLTGVLRLVGRLHEYVPEIGEFADSIAIRSDIVDAVAGTSV